MFKFGAIPQLRERLMCWRFGSRFEPLCDDAERRMQALGEAARTLRTSAALKEVWPGPKRGVAEPGRSMGDGILVLLC